MSVKHLIQYRLLVWYNRFRHSHMYKNKNMFRLMVIKWFLLTALLVCGLAVAPQMYLGYVIIILIALYASISLINTYTEHQLHRSNLRSEDGKGVKHDDLWGG